MHTASRAKVSMTLKVSTHSAKTDKTAVRYQVATHGQAGAKGWYTGKLKIAYKTAKPVMAKLTVKATTKKGTFSRTANVLILPKTK
jgi:carbon monoxide dehydrogenase subunit G